MQVSGPVKEKKDNQNVRIFIRGDEKETHEDKERYKEVLLPGTRTISGNCPS